MIIDIHTHTFPAKIAALAVEKLSRTSHTLPFSDGTPEGLLSNMQRAGIDRSVILPVATAARQVEHINDSSARLNEEYENKGLFSFGCVHPDHECYREELARVKTLGLKGIKIHPVYQGVNLDDIRFLRILDRAAELDLAVIAHAGYDIGFPGVVRCSPRMARNVIDQIGQFRLILAHMGGWRQWDEVLQLLADTGVYIDTAFSTGSFHPLDDGHWKTKEETDMMDTDQFMTLYHAFGPERIFFGTDSPWSDPQESLEFIQNLPLPQADREKILGDNALKLLNLK